MGRDRVILQLRAELVPDLLVNGIDDFLTGKHNETLPRIARMQTDEILELGKQNAHRDKPGGHLVLATSYSRTAYRRTTIGAAAFHCRVRNGNGWCHCATVTRNLLRIFRSKFLVN